uniref:Uncharacterized protein n=1 Tax=Rhizophora mucronata TaxID=61149 RepID=A0A2P2NT63_RHIMU
MLVSRNFRCGSLNRNFQLVIAVSFPCLSEASSPKMEKTMQTKTRHSRFVT